MLAFAIASSQIAFHRFICHQIQPDMKKQMRNAAKPFAASALIVLLLALSSFTPPVYKDPGNKEAVVKHLATSEDKVFFQVSMNNETGEKFSVTIKSEDGTTLFSEVYQDKNFDKKFVLDKSESKLRLTFIIRTLKDKEVQVFEINTTTRIVENYDVGIRKL